MGHARNWDSELCQQSQCSLFQHFSLWESYLVQILHEQRIPKALTKTTPHVSLEILWRAGETSAENFLTLTFRIAWPDGKAAQLFVLLTWEKIVSLLNKVDTYLLQYSKYLRSHGFLEETPPKALRSACSLFTRFWRLHIIWALLTSLNSPTNTCFTLYVFWLRWLSK